MSTKKHKEERHLSDLLDQQYLEAEDKSKLDFWEPFANIIIESIALRDLKGLTQADLAEKMKTSQPVISRFENMGRLPSYKFIAELAIALGHTPGITLYGDYMAIVPPEKQAWIKKRADKEKVPTRKFVQNLLDRHLEGVSVAENEDTNLGDAPSIPSNVIPLFDTSDHASPAISANSQSGQVELDTLSAAG